MAAVSCNWESGEAQIHQMPITLKPPDGGHSPEFGTKLGATDQEEDESFNM